MSHPLKAQVLQPAITSVLVQDIWLLNKKTRPHQQSPSWSLTTRIPLCLWICLFWMFPISGITLCVLCLLLSMSTVFSGSVHPWLYRNDTHPLATHMET